MSKTAFNYQFTVYTELTFLHEFWSNDKYQDVIKTKYLTSIKKDNSWPRNKIETNTDNNQRDEYRTLKMNNTDPSKNIGEVRRFIMVSCFCAVPAILRRVNGQIQLL
jgi:hypothetical protein